MITIAVDDRGLASLEIPDAGGEVHSYRFRLLRVGDWCCGVQLIRHDTGASYIVERRRMTCDCPAEKYRKRGAGHCKHIAAARALWAFLDQLGVNIDDQRNYIPSSAAAGF